MISCAALMGLIVFVDLPVLQTVSAPTTAEKEAPNQAFQRLTKLRRQ
jgi:hypothetical protein